MRLFLSCLAASFAFSGAAFAEQTKDEAQFSLNVVPFLSEVGESDEVDQMIKQELGGSLTVFAFEDGIDPRQGELVVNEKFETDESLAAVISEYYQMYLGEDFVSCASGVSGVEGIEKTESSTTDGPVVSTDGAGTLVPPKRDATWQGSEGGGCGTYAIAMCNRVLGDTKKGTAVTKKEWNEIAKDIKQDKDGGSFSTDRAKYYKEKGYCVMLETFSGKQKAYERMRDKIKRGCDVKMRYYSRDAKGKLSNGHVEVITGVDKKNGKLVARANSWGKSAVVQGGTSGGFSHTGGAVKDPQNWKANATTTYVSYVCPCSKTTWSEWLGLDQSQ